MNFGNLFGSPTLVGIDAGTHSIKVVEVRASSRHRFRVKGFAEVPTPEGAFANGVVADPQVLGRAIGDAVREGKIRARKAAIAVHPQSALLRTLNFPVMPVDELRSVIDLQPDRYIPIAGSEEAQYDVVILPHAPEAQQMQVVVAAAPMRNVANLMKACRVAGLTPVSVDMEPLALHRTAVIFQREAVGETSAIVDLGNGQAKISLFEGHVPVVSRVLSLSRTLAPAENGPQTVEETADLFLDIRRSLEFGIQQTSRPLDRILLTGGGAHDEYLSLSLSGYLRGFMGHRLAANFVVEPLQHPFIRLSPAYMLAFGLSLPQELFYDTN